jgi:hypothetical protein
VDDAQLALHTAEHPLADLLGELLMDLVRADPLAGLQLSADELGCSCEALPGMNCPRILAGTLSSSRSLELEALLGAVLVVAMVSPSCVVDLDNIIIGWRMIRRL